MDRCAGCPNSFDIDFSPAAFIELAAFAIGRINITWEFI
jgi:expansin (peptidoglycan-binding protein)